METRSLNPNFVTRFFICTGLKAAKALQAEIQPYSEAENVEEVEVAADRLAKKQVREPNEASDEEMPTASQSKKTKAKQVTVKKEVAKKDLVDKFFKSMEKNPPSTKAKRLNDQQETSSSSELSVAREQRERLEAAEMSRKSSTPRHSDESAEKSSKSSISRHSDSTPILPDDFDEKIIADRKEKAKKAKLEQRNNGGGRKETPLKTPVIPPKPQKVAKEGNDSKKPSKHLKPADFPVVKSPKVAAVGAKKNKSPGSSQDRHSLVEDATPPTRSQSKPPKKPKKMGGLSQEAPHTSQRTSSKKGIKKRAHAKSRKIDHKLRQLAAEALEGQHNKMVDMVVNQINKNLINKRAADSAQRAADGEQREEDIIPHYRAKRYIPDPTFALDIQNLIPGIYIPVKYQWEFEAMCDVLTTAARDRDDETGDPNLYRRLVSVR